MSTGAVALPLMIIGRDLLGAFAGLALFYGALIAFFGGFDRTVTPGYLVEASLVEFYGVPAVVVVATAVTLVTLAFLGGWLLLRFSGHRRPAGVMWAALGVSLLPSLVGLVVAVGIANVVSESLPPFAEGDTDGAQLRFLSLVVGFDALFGILIGTFTWWWMAHVLRERTSRTASWETK